MDNATALIAIPQLPAANSPARMPSLPAWLQRQTDVLASELQKDSEGRYRTMPVLPAELVPNSCQRRIIEQHISSLEAFLDPGRPFTLRETVMTNDQAIATMIASLLLKGGARLDEAASDAQTEDYLDAIEDLPAWAVREAIRKWNRAESVPLDGKPHNFIWRPAPPVLARLARLERWIVAGRVVALRGVLSARPKVIYTDEYRAEMQARLMALGSPRLPYHEAASIVPTQTIDVADKVEAAR